MRNRTGLGCVGRSFASRITAGYRPGDFRARVPAQAVRDPARRIPARPHYLHAWKSVVAARRALSRRFRGTVPSTLSTTRGYLHAGESARVCVLRGRAGRSLGRFSDRRPGGGRYRFATCREYGQVRSSQHASRRWQHCDVWQRNDLQRQRLHRQRQSMRCRRCRWWLRRLRSWRRWWRWWRLRVRRAAPFCSLISAAVYRASSTPWLRRAGSNTPTAP
jgi:hypothetical protein